MDRKRGEVGSLNLPVSLNEDLPRLFPPVPFPKAKKMTNEGVFL
jgi:hypothetical protein